jgi:hypothetical protein
MTVTKKMVVFDLDETLGYFIELGMFWDALENYNKKHSLHISMNQHLFNQLLDLYPEFLRPNIIKILSYLKKRKQKNHCSKLTIYTNNQGPQEWAKFIIGYFESKLGYKLFDQIVAAFKVQGKRVELCRTSHMKNHQDLIRCTKVPATTQICFLDDVFYPKMEAPNIYYINIKPYIHDLPFDTMIDRFLQSNIIPITEEKQEHDLYQTQKHELLTYLKRYHYSYTNKDQTSINIDKILSKKIMNHLAIFFDNVPPSTNKTQRNKRCTNKTQKIRKHK